MWKWALPLESSPGRSGLGKRLENLLPVHMIAGAGPDGHPHASLFAAAMLPSVAFHGDGGTHSSSCLLGSHGVREQSAKDFEKMGGLGSGRWRDRGRKTVESYRTLDVDQLSKKGWLRPGLSSTCQWIDGNEVVSLNLRAEAERVRLSYAVRVGDGEREDVVDTISVVYLRCRFGGNRAYFICPGPGGGTNCGRRITKLHLSGRYFLCRHCNQLVYACQYEQGWERALRRANKLKQRLGVNVGVDEPFPDKPKGMWARSMAACLMKYYKPRYRPTKHKRIGSNGSWNRSRAMLKEVRHPLS
jgi:hypothetical protein